MLSRSTTARRGRRAAFALPGSKIEAPGNLVQVVTHIELLLLTTQLAQGIVCLCKTERSSISRNIPSTMDPASAQQSSLAVVPFHVCGVTTRRASHSNRNCFIERGAVYCVGHVLKSVQKKRFH